jgi:hypothetical protein
VDPKTLKHLQLSARNRDLALALLSPSQSGLQPSPWEWVVVIAFYAAVHAVNAYLWEARRYEPANHGDRRTWIRNSLPITACSSSYRALEKAGFFARYNENYAIGEQGARGLVTVNFRQVEATVMQALGQPAPAW